MKKIGITGGQGFIGKWTTQACLDRGYSVLVLDHKQRQPEQYIDDPRVDYIWGDVRDETVMLELAAHVDGIIHLAAVLGTQETVDDPRPAANTNLMGGLNFLHSIKRYDIPGVYICVGNHWMNNPYSISKTAVERFCFMYRKEHGTRINQVRAVNAYGPLQASAPPYGAGKVRKITPAFVNRALSGQDIEVYGDGEQVSDMVWVGDVAETMVTALEHAEQGITYDFTIEAGPRENHTVNEVATIVMDAAARAGFTPGKLVHLPMRPGEVAGDRVTADVTTLERAGIDPDSFKDLYQGIEETVQWFIETEGVTWNNPFKE